MKLTLKERVQSAHQSNLGGLTDDELSIKLARSVEECRKRRSELCNDGILKDSGHVRMTLSGRLAKVWRLTEKGKAAMPAAPKPAKTILGLTREEVDPEFNGTPIEFELNYGKVNLRTKDQIEADHQKVAFVAWQKALLECEKPLRELLQASEKLPIELFRDYLQKRDPDKRAKWLERLVLIEKAPAATQSALNVALEI